MNQICYRGSPRYECVHEITLIYSGVASDVLIVFGVMSGGDTLYRFVPIMY